MAINVPVIVSVVEVGSPTAYLRVTWDHDITGSPATDGYLIEWDFDNPAWNPSWVIPPAVDLGLLDGDGKSPVRRYTVLINLSNAFVSDWETFEEYEVGSHSVLSYGGSKWAGPAVAIETYIGYKGFGDDFESYSVGQHSELGGGKGWASPAEAIGMGDFEIVMQTISGVDDQRVVVDNAKSPWVRTMAIGDDWTSLKFGFRFGSRRSTNWSTPPRIYMGMCSGINPPPSASNPNHFFGWTLPAGEPIGYIGSNTIRLGANGFARFALIQNGTETLSSYNTQQMDIAGNLMSATINNSAVYFIITKGSPWTISAWFPTNATWRECTLQNFIDGMNAPSIPEGMALKTTNQFTPDEVTYGEFDTICFAFLGSTDGFEISDIAYARLA